MSSGLEMRLTGRAVAVGVAMRGCSPMLPWVCFVLNAVTMVGALLLFYRRRVVNPLAHLNLGLRDLAPASPGRTSATGGHLGDWGILAVDGDLSRASGRSGTSTLGQNQHR